MNDFATFLFLGSLVLTIAGCAALSIAYGLVGRASKNLDDAISIRVEAQDLRDSADRLLDDVLAANGDEAALRRSIERSAK